MTHHDGVALARVGLDLVGTRRKLREEDDRLQDTTFTT